MLPSHASVSAHCWLGVAKVPCGVPPSFPDNSSRGRGPPLNILAFDATRTRASHDSTLGRRSAPHAVFTVGHSFPLW